MAIHTGVQFRYQLAPRQTVRFYTFGWPARWHVLWRVMSVTPRNTVGWDVDIERASADHATYWITVTNTADTHTDIEGRYAIAHT